MRSELLSLVVCGGLPLLFVGLAIILGVRARINFANRIFHGLSRGKLIDWEIGLNPKRIRILIGVEIMTILGLVLTLITVQVCPATLTPKTQMIFVLLLIVGLVAGVILYKDFITQINKRL